MNSLNILKQRNEYIFSEYKPIKIEHGLHGVLRKRIDKCNTIAS
jgi:hypothetical protein